MLFLSFLVFSVQLHLAAKDWLDAARLVDWCALAACLHNIVGMSQAANWSYTATATLWLLLGIDDWTQQKTYGAPEPVACDYSAESVRMTDAKGVEFTTRQIIFTERADIKQGDMILIGESTEAGPTTAGAFEVRAVTRFADTFDQVRDDFKVMT